MATPRSVEINLLARPFRVACSEEQEAALRAAARLLDQKMREIRDAGKVVGIERIALMAGLNLAHEVLSRGADEPADADLARCHALVDALLAEPAAATAPLEADAKPA